MCIAGFEITENFLKTASFAITYMQFLESNIVHIYIYIGLQGFGALGADPRSPSGSDPKIQPKSVPQNIP